MNKERQIEENVKIAEMTAEIVELKGKIADLMKDKAYLQMVVSDERERNKRLSIENGNLKGWNKK